MTINAFGLGIGTNDAAPFFGSDFHMPVGWAVRGYEGSRPSRAEPGMRFVLFGNGVILATTTFLGYSKREHRFEHRSTDGRRLDYGHGYVLDLDPNDWVWVNTSCVADGQSYRYGHISDDGRFRQVVEADS